MLVYDGLTSEDMASRANQGNAAIYVLKLNGILQSNNVSWNTKIRIYKTAIESIGNNWCSCV